MFPFNTNKVSKVYHPKTRLFGILVTFCQLILSNSRCGGSSEKQVEATGCERLLRETSLTAPGLLSRSVETAGLTSAEPTYHVQVLFLVLPQLPPQHLLCLQVTVVFKVLVSTILVSYALLLGLSHVYRGSIYY